MARYCVASFPVMVLLLAAVLAYVPLSMSHDSVGNFHQHNIFQQVLRSHFQGILSGESTADHKTISTGSVTHQATLAAAEEADSPYLPVGYVYVQYSNRKTDATCSQAAMTVGVPVDTCVATDKTSYKVRITTDNCLGAAVFYYHDVNCTMASYNQSLSALEDSCNVYDGEREVSFWDTTVTVPLYFWQIKCTAQPTKPMPVASAVVEFYSDSAACTKPIGYSTMSADLCLPKDGGQYSAALRCSSTGVVSLNEYVGSSCGPVVSDSTIYPANTCTAASSFTRSFTSPAARVPASPLTHLQHNMLKKSVHDKKLAEQPAAGLGGAASGVQAVQMSCAEKNTDYSAIISVQQVLEDVTYSSFLWDRADYTSALQHAVAAALNASRAVAFQGGVLLGDVYITQVAQAPAPPVTDGSGSDSGDQSDEDCEEENKDDRGDNADDGDRSWGEDGWSREDWGSQSDEEDSRDRSNDGNGHWGDGEEGSDPDCESDSPGSSSHSIEDVGRNSSAPTMRPTRRPSSPTATPTRRPSAPSAPVPSPTRRPTTPTASPSPRPTSPSAGPSVRPSRSDRGGGGGWTRSSSAPSVTSSGESTSPTPGPTRRSRAPTVPTEGPTTRPASLESASPTLRATRGSGGWQGGGGGGSGGGNGGGSRPSSDRVEVLSSTESAPAAPSPPSSTRYSPNDPDERSDELSVSYTVVSYQPGMTNDLLAGALNDAVRNGTFDRLLKKWALSVGARGLTRASSSALEVNALVTEHPVDGPGSAGPPTGGGGGGGGAGGGTVSGHAKKSVHWFTLENVLTCVAAVVVGVAVCFLLRMLYLRVFPGSDAVLPQTAKPMKSTSNKKDKALSSEEENYDGTERDEEGRRSRGGAGACGGRGCEQYLNAGRVGASRDNS